MSSASFFPKSQYPGLFRSTEWISAWQIAWNGKCSNHSIDAGWSTYTKKVARMLPITTLVADGVSTAAIPSLRSEYVSLDQKEIDQLADNFDQSGAHQLWMPDILRDSGFLSDLKIWCKRNGFFYLIRESDIAYAVDLTNGDFDHYVAQLKPQVRSKIYHRRSRLMKEGVVSRSNWWPNIDGFIALLNGFHQTRWGKPCYEGPNLIMITSLLKALGNAGYYIDLSVLTLDQSPISAVLDIHYLERIYNLQSGFDNRFGSRLSLGQLHLGLQIESAFTSTNTVYDFLIGRGKVTAYKKELATMTAEVESALIIKPRWLYELYRLNDMASHYRLG